MEEESLHGYPKRRRLERSCKCLQPHFNFPVDHKQMKIFQLPPEILQHIFQWIPSRILALQVKRVCKYFQTTVNELLCIKFFGLSSRLSSLYHVTADFFDSAQDLDAHTHMFKIVTTTEILIHEYKMLEASIWRYMYQSSSDFVFCICFAKILDLFDFVLYRMQYRKGEFSATSRNHKALKKMLKMIKKFIFHFERHSEIDFNRNCFVSGAKICDIFDSCIFSNRQVIYEEVVDGICYLKVKYVLPNAWFTAISISDCPNAPARSTWEEQQRLMYLRLRRLASTHTGHQMHLHHWIQAQQLLEPGMEQVLNITNSVYCGYGEFNDELFFYGNFNQGGHVCKIKRMEHRDVRPEDLISQKLEIIVDLKCHLQQAPLLVYRKHGMHVDKKAPRMIIQRRSARLQKASFYMRIEFISDFVKPLWPSTFVYVLSEENRIELLKNNGKFMKM